MGGSVGRVAGLIAAGAAVLIFSFWLTLTVIDSTAPADINLADVPLTNDDGTPRATRASTVRDLPPAPTGYPFSSAWDGIDGLNVQVMGPGPVNADNLALSLFATQDVGLHRLGLQLVGVPKDRAIRLTVWVKAPEGTRINVDVRDGRGNTGEPQNRGAAAIDAHGTVLGSNGNVQTSVQAGPGDWVRVSVQTKTADGLVVLYLGLLNSSSAGRFGGNGEQMIFGGVEFTTA